MNRYLQTQIGLVRTGKNGMCRGKFVNSEHINDSAHPLSMAWASVGDVISESACVASLHLRSNSREGARPGRVCEQV
jgi:hypothetical protein